MSQNKEEFTAEERRELAVKAVNRLIADVEAKRVLENKELTETIAACIGEAGEQRLRAATASPEVAARRGRRGRTGTSRRLGIVLTSFIKA